jgi:hypothetical protein
VTRATPVTLALRVSLVQPALSVLKAHKVKSVLLALKVLRA